MIPASCCLILHISHTHTHTYPSTSTPATNTHKRCYKTSMWAKPREKCEERRKVPAGLAREHTFLPNLCLLLQNKDISTYSACAAI